MSGQAISLNTSESVEATVVGNTLVNQVNQVNLINEVSEAYVRADHAAMIMEADRKVTLITQNAQAQIQAIREFITEILTTHYNLKEGDTVDTTGKIVRVG